MPEYLYQHPQSEEYKYIFLGMEDIHEYVDDDGVEWNRIFTTTQLSAVTIGEIDPFDKNDFINKTAQKKGSYGDLLDASRDLGRQRKEKLGYDPVQNKYFDDFSKSRRGLRHPQDKRGHKKIKGIDVEF